MIRDTDFIKAALWFEKKWDTDFIKAALWFGCDTDALTRMNLLFW
jgi:hypothetical protein